MQDDIIVIFRGIKYKLVPLPFDEDDSSDRFDKFMDYITSVEGGYSNHASDKGSATKYGIIEKVARANGYNGDMKELPIAVAKSIYKKDYYERYNLDKIKNNKIALSIFDWVVNSGTWGIKKAQQAINNILGTNLVIDGILGQKSIKAINEVESSEFLTEYHDIQRQFYKAIVKNNPSQSVFLKGWFNRVDKKEKFIENMEV